ncbi:hypothetical protein C2869_09330 [Saccharobesus litoralis]|uniref:Uncharacterized protein n=1 Tax=Saccharobesus litoralis TaxID=2172099 RepID=A0A2S0VQZ7_9ALTE|nr:CsgG/HfaB family protein [Saccharobesus litoralis]AWB66619.1 hypothetical protein C2869_09330 [Saccharobesus litoralis]
MLFRQLLCKLAISVSVSLSLLLFILPTKAEQQARLAIWPIDSTVYGQEMDLDTKQMIEQLVPDLLTASLSQLPITIVERQKLLEILNEQKLSSSQLADESTRIRLGKLLGAQYMLFGTYLKIGPQAQMELRIVNTETTEIVATASAEQGHNDLLTTTETISQQLSLSFKKCCLAK